MQEYHLRFLSRTFILTLLYLDVLLDMPCIVCCAHGVV